MKWEIIWRTILWSLIVAAFVYGVITAVLFIYQSRFIYFPYRMIEVTPDTAGLSYEDVSFKSSDGLNLSGWFIPAEDQIGVLLFCHGNAGNISHRLDSILLFNRLRLGVLIFDYRGYGKSGGAPSEIGTYLDAEAAWNYLVHERKVPPHEIVVFGRSLGGSIAARLSEMYTPKALIIESTFTSMGDLAARFYPFLPVRLLLRFQYDTLSSLKRVSAPILIVHSRDDELVPFSHAEKLFSEFEGPKELLEIRGGHNDGFISTGFHYEEGLRKFIARHL
jgi:fermentation-respiration switch protein FrsA (DUF1100 family)